MHHAGRAPIKQGLQISQLEPAGLEPLAQLRIVGLGWSTD
jgi:hypothetical protein